MSQFVGSATPGLVAAIGSFRAETDQTNGLPRIRSNRHRDSARAVETTTAHSHDLTRTAARSPSRGCPAPMLSHRAAALRLGVVLAATENCRSIVDARLKRAYAPITVSRQLLKEVV
jgi:hypothetical protein